MSEPLQPAWLVAAWRNLDVSKVQVPRTIRVSLPTMQRSAMPM